MANPIGRLMTNIQRQERSTKRPPIGGPAAAAVAATPAQIPTTMVWWRKGNDG